MENDIRQWEQLHKLFNMDGRGKPSPRAAASTFIAWPVILQIIREGVMENSRVLDFGCGNGRFCRHMKSEGMKVEGIDISRGMIDAAVKNSSRQIHYHVGGREALKQIKGKFDVITALMVFPFMKDFEPCIPLFSELLNERGLLIFSVYNPDFIENCISQNVGFHSLRRTGKTSVTSMELEKNLSVDTYIRHKDHYRETFEKYGFEYMSTRYPPFTPEFVAEHGWTLPTDNAEYLIMSLRKKH